MRVVFRGGFTVDSDGVVSRGVCGVREGVREVVSALPGRSPLNFGDFFGLCGFLVFWVSHPTLGPWGGG